MSKLFQVVLLLILGLAIFVVGWGAGIFYQTEKDALQISNSADTIKKLTSKAIPSIIAYGKITSIEGRNLTVSFNGENATVKMSDDAIVTLFTNDGNGKTSQQNLTFNQIKTGETASINIKILPDGQLQGDSVTVISSSQPVK